MQFAFYMQNNFFLLKISLNWLNESNLYKLLFWANKTMCRISMNKRIKKIDVILLAHFILNLIIVRKYAKSSCNYMQCQII